MNETMNLNDLLDFAAEAWGEPRHAVWFEVSMKRVAIRAKGASDPLFVDVAPEHPAVGLVAETVLRRAIAERLLQRAEQNTREAQASRDVAKRREQWAREQTTMARRIDPQHIGTQPLAENAPTPEVAHARFEIDTTEIQRVVAEAVDLERKAIALLLGDFAASLPEDLRPAIAGVVEMVQQRVGRRAVSAPYQDKVGES